MAGCSSLHVYAEITYMGKEEEEEGGGYSLCTHTHKQAPYHDMAGCSSLHVHAEITYTMKEDEEENEREE